MSLRLKINLIVAALTVLFAATVLALMLRGLRESVHEEVVAANRVAEQLLRRTAWRYAAQGTPAMLLYLDGVGRVRSNDITLLDTDGRELYRSPSPTYKAGRNAPAWFSALVAPEPSVQAIEFPDGKLVVRSNSSRAELDAWDEMSILALVALLLLLLVNAAVFWLLGRSLRPFAQIVQALNQLQAGGFDAALPPLPGTEAAAIGAAFNRMVGELRRHIETEKRALQAEMQLSDNRELTQWIDRRLEAERRMIARELHDELGQSVTAVRSMALAIAARVQTLDPPSETAARLIADESSRLYDAMHGIIPRLTPLLLDNFGLEEALNDLAERTRRSQADAQIALAVELNDVVLGADAALALYRCAQEGITNALRHGQARQLELTLHGRAEAVTLTLNDDGRGLPLDWSQRPGHHGLRWLAERVQTLGGSFEIGPREPRGVCLRVRLPVPAQTAASSRDDDHDQRAAA